MKNPNTGKTFLDLDDINNVMPKKQTLTKAILGSRSSSRGIYTMEDGTLVSISNSRAYTKGAIAWYYVYADRYLEIGVKYMLFTIGFKGFVLLPIDVFQPFKIGCSWKEGMNRGERRYRIDIYYRDDKWFFVNYSARYENKLDVTPYFVPFNE